MRNDVSFIAAPIVALSASFMLFLGACAHSERSSLDDPIQPARIDSRPAVDLRARALQNFPRAAYHKPRSPSAQEYFVTMAPILIHEVRSNTPDRELSLGYVNHLPDGRFEVDGSRPTVYYARHDEWWNAARFPQIIFFWFYSLPFHEPITQSAQSEARSAIAFPPSQGIRMTLSLDGFPLTWEIWRQDADMETVFVSAAFEKAVQDSWGEPLQGRTFSSELPIDDRPDVIVARILDDGPIPMGPYVYLSPTSGPLDALPYFVTTVLCRCMPSQVDSFVLEVPYDLRPVSELPELLAAQLAGWTSHTSSSNESLSDSATSEGIWTKLRWPDMRAP